MKTLIRKLDLAVTDCNEALTQVADRFVGSNNSELAMLADYCKVHGCEQHESPNPENCTMCGATCRLRYIAVEARKAMEGKKLDHANLRELEKRVRSASSIMSVACDRLSHIRDGKKFANARRANELLSDLLRTCQSIRTRPDVASTAARSD